MCAFVLVPFPVPWYYIYLGTFVCVFVDRKAWEIMGLRPWLVFRGECRCLWVFVCEGVCRCVYDWLVCVFGFILMEHGRVVRLLSVVGMCMKGVYIPSVWLECIVGMPGYQESVYSKGVYLVHMVRVYSLCVY